MSIDNIERTVQSKIKVNFRTLELVFPEPGIATFARSRPMKFALLMALVVGLVLMAGCPLFLFHFRFVERFGRQIFLFLIIFELISSAVVTLAVMMHFRTRTLVLAIRAIRDSQKRRDKPAWSRGCKSLTWKAVATHHGPESWRRDRKGTT